ncbi:MAG TPA: MarR family winged helix-turn-helix transcriptional regulator [Actinomycetota bacterium]|jgi:DNA-binding MarR family transcriptional regulator|nr:MarR family winged helix-turn-helix transcriptional regulator [Actinomycetota bacterium]
MTRKRTFERQESLGYMVNLEARMLAQALHRRIAPYGVVPGQFPALLVLYERDGRTQAELCREVRIEQPTMANTLRRMERDGLVIRQADGKDGRRQLIFLTERARGLRPKLLAVAREVNGIATRGLTKRDATQVLATIRLVIENLERDLDRE